MSFQDALFYILLIAAIVMVLTIAFCNGVKRFNKEMDKTFGDDREKHN